MAAAIRRLFHAYDGPETDTFLRREFMRNCRSLMLGLAILVLGLAGTAWASVPKIVFCDDFGYPS